MGLSAVALYGAPGMRTLEPQDVNAGLPAPYAAAALLGQGGAAAILVLVFLAITSATSAELIAVSTILTYDVYKVRPQWTPWVILMRLTFCAIEIYQPQRY
jgi:Na+/proline symporter